MSRLFHNEEKPQRVYWDRKYFTSFDQQVEALQGSSTLYVGNLSFFTTELQIHETFSRVGPVKRIIMGLNREKKTPCGFCFVEYFTHQDALDCLRFISGTVCDDNVIRCELDAGFKPGRQFGRGKSGGQVRDERRHSHDPSRSGVTSYTDSFAGKKHGRDDNYDRSYQDRRGRGKERFNQHRQVFRNNDDDIGGRGRGLDSELRASRPSTSLSVTISTTLGSSGDKGNMDVAATEEQSSYDQSAEPAEDEYLMEVEDDETSHRRKAVRRAIDE